jgi:signal transduction histidine kinase
MSLTTWSSAAEDRFVALETPFTWVRLATIAGITAMYFTLGDRSQDRFALPVLAWSWAYNLFVLIHKPHQRYPHRKTRWWTAAFNVLTSVPWIAATGGIHSPYVPILYLATLSGNVRFPPREGAIVTLAFLVSYLAALLALRQLTVDPVALVFQMAFFASAALIGMVFSIVFLQQVERRLRVSEEAVRARDELISVAGHDLRTPVTAATLVLQLLQRELAKGAAPSVLAPRVNLAMHQVDKLGEMTGQLLDVSRIAAGRLTVALEQVDLGAVVCDVVARLFPPAPDAPLVAVKLDGSAVGRWDRGHLEQIASNLVANAVKYGRGKPVDVHVTRAGSTAKLEVSDHGMGIPPEEQEHIFARFHRAATTHRNARGVGLGLWITRNLVEALGGQIRVASAEEMGSTFTVELPLEGPTAAA